MHDKDKHIKEHLLPERHSDLDLFVCDVADAVLKDILPEMEHPFYSLSKKPELAVKKYEHNGNYIEITPSVKGLATIYDKDILIYCISQVMASLKKDEKVSRRMRLNARDLLVFTNRGTAGKDYKALCDAFDRLAGTRISTNIRTGKEEQYDTFGLIDAATIKRKHGVDGRLLWCEISLSDWVFNAIRSREVLTLHKDYFRLRKPIEKRIYELARKHCGSQPSWKCSLEIMFKKSGSRGSLKEFRRAIKHLSEHNHLPDYEIEFFPEDDVVVFKKRGLEEGNSAAFKLPSKVESIYLDSEAYEEARSVAPGWDPYYLESQWRDWMFNSSNELPKTPEKAFIGFCRKWFERRGRP